MKKLATTIGVLALGVLGGMLATGLAVAGRNTAGTFSFSSVPGGFPYVSGTTVSSSGVNANMAEVRAGLTDSLSRTGSGGMQAPLRTVDGTKTAPALSFTNETGAGLYRPGTHDVRMALNGADSQAWTATGTTIPGTLGVTGATTIGGTLGVTGAATFASSATAGDATNQSVIQSGTIELTAASGLSYIDFKDNTGQDYLSRIIKLGPGDTGLQVLGAKFLVPATTSDAASAATRSYVDGVSSSLTTFSRRFAVARAPTGAMSTGLNTIAVTLSPGFADTNYTITCTLENTGSTLDYVARVASRTATTANVLVQSAGGQASTVHCIAIHD